MKPVPVLVIIVNYRTPELALAAAASLQDEVRTRGDTHVVIVDNGSGDNSVDTLSAGIARHGFHRWCTLLPVDLNSGFAAGNNAGLRWYQRETGGQLPRYSWLLNPDTLAHAGAASALISFLNSHPAAGIAGGRCLWEGGEVRHSAFRFPSPASELMGAVNFGPLTRLLARREVPLPIPSVPTQVEWVGGSSFMIRREVIERIGMMDEGYFLYFEESDYCARAIAAGFEVWTVPDSVITHIGGQSTGVTGAARRLNRRPRYWFYSRARFLTRRYGPGMAHLANLLWLAGYPLGSALALLRGRRRDDPPRLWRDFLTHYYGRNGLMYDTDEMMA